MAVSKYRMDTWPACYIKDKQTKTKEFSLVGSWHANVEKEFLLEVRTNNLLLLEISS